MALRTGALVSMGLLFGAVTAAQELPSSAGLLDERLVLAWRGSTELEERGVFELDPLICEAIAAQIATTPPPVSREFLDGPTEDLLRFHGLPGGIVLGLAAQPGAELARDLDGARVERTPELGLQLRLADGTALRCPTIPAETLRACLAFLAQGTDSVVDLEGDAYAQPKLASAFADSDLAALLVRMDRLPHSVLPETRSWKSVIVDREVRLRRVGDELLVGADLEVRLYDDPIGTGWARRARTIDVRGADFVGPRLAGELDDELAPLAELAGWLGFLRWIELRDAAGFATLRDLVPSATR